MQLRRQSVSRRCERSPSVSLNSPRGHCAEYASRTRGVPACSRHPRAQPAPPQVGALDASMLRLSMRGNLHVCWRSECRNAKRPTRRNGRNIEFSADPARAVPCDAVAIGGKLLQNNGIELCVPDRCCDSGGSPSAPSLSAGIAWRGLQLCCAGYFGQGCMPRGGSASGYCNRRAARFAGLVIALGQGGNFSAFQPRQNQGCAKPNSRPATNLFKDLRPEQGVVHDSCWIVACRAVGATFTVWVQTASSAANQDDLASHRVAKARKTRDSTTGAAPRRPPPPPAAA